MFSSAMEAECLGCQSLFRFLQCWLCGENLAEDELSRTCAPQLMKKPTLAAARLANERKRKMEEEPLVPAHGVQPGVGAEPAAAAAPAHRRRVA